MLMEQSGQHLTLTGLTTHLLDAHRLQLPQPLGDGLRRQGAGLLRGQAHPVWTTPSPGRQLDQAALFEFEQQTASSHILEEPRSIAPVPLQG